MNKERIEELGNLLTEYHKAKRDYLIRNKDKMQRKLYIDLQSELRVMENLSLIIYKDIRKGEEK